MEAWNWSKCGDDTDLDSDAVQTSCVLSLSDESLSNQNIVLPLEIWF